MQRAVFIESHIHNAQFTYGGNERRRVPSTNLPHFRYCNDQNLRELLFAEIARLEDEFSDVVAKHA